MKNDCISSRREAADGENGENSKEKKQKTKKGKRNPPKSRGEEGVNCTSISQERLAGS